MTDAPTTPWWRLVHPCAYAVLGAGGIAAVCSFLPYYTWSVEFYGSRLDIDVNAWSGVYGWVGALLLLAAAIVALVPVMKGYSRAWHIGTALIATALGLICLVLAGFIVPASDNNLSTGHHIGYWISLVAALVSTACAVQWCRISWPRRSAGPWAENRRAC